MDLAIGIVIWVGLIRGLHKARVNKDLRVRVRVGLLLGQAVKKLNVLTPCPSALFSWPATSDPASHAQWQWIEPGV